MALAKVHKAPADDWQWKAPEDLAVNDLVARVTQSGSIGQERVVLATDEDVHVLGMPKRYAADDGADFAQWVDDGFVLVIGTVEPPAPEAPKPATAKRPTAGPAKPATAKPAAPKPAKPAAPKPTPIGNADADATDAVHAIAEALRLIADALVAMTR